MRRARYQEGCLTKSKRKSGDVWEFRFRERRPGGIRKMRCVVLGPVAQYRTRAAALGQLQVLRANINMEVIDSERPVLTTFKSLAEHYQLKELQMDNHVKKAYSTKNRTTGVLQKWIIARWGEYTPSDIKPVAVEAEISFCFSYRLKLIPDSRELLRGYRECGGLGAIQTNFFLQLPLSLNVALSLLRLSTARWRRWRWWRLPRTHVYQMPNLRTGRKLGCYGRLYNFGACVSSCNVECRRGSRSLRDDHLLGVNLQDARVVAREQDGSATGSGAIEKDRACRLLAIRHSDWRIYRGNSDRLDGKGRRRASCGSRKCDCYRHCAGISRRSCEGCAGGTRRNRGSRRNVGNPRRTGGNLNNSNCGSVSCKGDCKLHPSSSHKSCCGGWRQSANGKLWRPRQDDCEIAARQNEGLWSLDS